MPGNPALWGAIAVLVAMVLVRWARPFRVAVEGRSMAPALQPGDVLIAVHPRRIRLGSLVVLEHPDRPGFELVKRVERVPGEDWLGPTEFWVAGGVGAASTDSRTFGPVRRSAIKGVVVARYWPPSRIGVLRRRA